MRLDLFLKISRLIKRRTLAHEFCQRGWIEVNGIKAKPGKRVTEGDHITLLLGSKRKEVEVLELPKGNVSARDASRLYKIISEEPLGEVLEFWTEDF